LGGGIGGTVADGAGDIRVDDGDFVVARFLFGDGGEGTEKEAADVGEDGGAARGDAALLEEGEIRELEMDVRGGFFFGKLGSEQGGEVVGVVAERGGVTLAEGGVRRGERSAALATVGSAMLTACR
jgi:hypothetical protein